MANDILAMVESLEGRLIPEQVEVEVTRNYGETAQEKVNELLFKLVVATGIVTVLVWYALGLKPAIVVTVPNRRRNAAIASSPMPSAAFRTSAFSP